MNEVFEVKTYVVNESVTRKGIKLYQFIEKFSGVVPTIGISNDNVFNHEPIIAIFFPTNEKFNLERKHYYEAKFIVAMGLYLNCKVVKEKIWIDIVPKENKYRFIGKKDGFVFTKCGQILDLYREDIV